MQSRKEEFLGVDHKPYIRCNTWALMLFHTVGLGSELNTVSSLQLIVSSLLLRRKFREMGDKINKNPCHPSKNASHHTTEPPFFHKQYPQTVWKIRFHHPLSQHHQQQLKNTSRCRIRRVATSTTQKTRRADNEGSTCKVLQGSC